jgi:hypothetical protein
VDLRGILQTIAGAEEKKEQDQDQDYSSRAAYRTPTKDEKYVILDRSAFGSGRYSLVHLKPVD